VNARQRLRRSYEMMLGFYGVSLGAGDALSRAVNWEERFDNLTRSGLIQLIFIVAARGSPVSVLVE